jgi:molybdenum cofactor cytidylyltransferase
MLETILLAAQPNELSVVRERVSSICQLLQCFQIESPVHLVTGARHTQVKLAVSDQPITLVYNPYWQDGMGHSIAAGIQDVHYDTKAVLVVDVADQRFDESIIKQLIEKWQSNKQTMVLKEGLPAIFGAELFPELASMVDHLGQVDLPQANYETKTQYN